MPGAGGVGEAVGEDVLERWVLVSVDEDGIGGCLRWCGKTLQETGFEWVH